VSRGGKKRHSQVVLKLAVDAQSHWCFDFNDLDARKPGQRRDSNNQKQLEGGERNHEIFLILDSHSARAFAGRNRMVGLVFG
jgi:hypothetical protein